MEFVLRQRPGCTITRTLGLSHGFFRYLVFFVPNCYSRYSSASITQKIVHRREGIAICWLLACWTVSIHFMGAFIWGISQTHRMICDGQDLTEITKFQVPCHTQGHLPLEQNMLEFYQKLQHGQDSICWTHHKEKENHFELYFTSFLYTCSQNVFL